MPTAPPALPTQPAPQRRMLEFVLVAAVFLLMGVALTAVTLRYVVR